MSDGVPKDRAMWFSFLQHKTYTKISLSLIVSCNDHEDTGEKQTTAHESGPADDLEKEAPKGPGEQHITEDNDQGEREDSQRGNMKDRRKENMTRVKQKTLQEETLRV